MLLVVFAIYYMVKGAYLIYLKNIMEITLRKGLDPANAASFEKAP